MAKSKEVVTREGGQGAEIQRILNGELPALPPAIAETVNLRGWLASLLVGADYHEPDEGYLAREMGLNTLLGSIEDMASDADGLPGIQDIVENFAGATTGPIRVTDIYVTSSSLDEGQKTYLILTYISLENNEEVRCSTGATAIQFGMARYLMGGIWPIECQIVRLATKDKGGRHLLKVWPVDA